MNQDPKPSSIALDAREESEEAFTKSREFRCLRLVSSRQPEVVLDPTTVTVPHKGSEKAPKLLIDPPRNAHVLALACLNGDRQVRRVIVKLHCEGDRFGIR